MTHYDYGFRIYNPAIAKFLSVDPLAEKFAGWSPYNYVLNNPVRLTDPDGRAPKTVKPGSDAALKAIRSTLSKEDSRFVQLDINGNIDRELLNQSSNMESSNLSALKELVNSDILYIVDIVSTYISAENPVPNNLVGDGEYGTKGVTLFPNAEIDRSPDNNIYIYTSSKLSDIRQAENVSHELYGHALFYNKKSKGADVNPNHDYRSVISYDKDGMPNGSIRTEFNILLKNQIDNAVRETKNNFEDRKN